MTSWIGLIGVLAGAGIALFGQYSLKRLDRRHTDVSLLFEQCAQLVALSNDFRNRLWEERKLGRKNSVAEWNVSDHRLAEARIRILCTDERIVSALDRLSSTGRDLGKIWRLSNTESDDLQRAWVANKMAVEAFIEIAGSVMRRHMPPI